MILLMETSVYIFLISQYQVKNAFNDVTANLHFHVIENVIQNMPNSFNEEFIAFEYHNKFNSSYQSIFITILCNFSIFKQFFQMMFYISCCCLMKIFWSFLEFKNDTIQQRKFSCRPKLVDNYVVLMLFDSLLTVQTSLTTSIGVTLIPACFSRATNICASR